jgi:tetratricopeptide (TPR) repeat protein
MGALLGCGTYVRETPDFQTQQLIDRGVAFLELGQYSLSEASFQMALEHQATPEGYDGLACTYLRAGKYTQAKSILDSLNEWFPSYEPLANRYAYLYDQQGNKKVAQHLYQKATAIDPSDVAARNNLAALSYEKGGNFNKIRAKQYLEEALVLQPEPSILHNLSKVSVYRNE